MKKEKFLISTIILIIGGALTKLLSMIIRIVMTRTVGIEGISLYMLIFPTFSLFMVLSQLSFPIAISKLVSEEKRNNKTIIFSVIPLSFILNILLMIIIFLIAPYLSNNLLKDPRCYYPILAIALVLPFDSLSSIIRGYFFGKQKMFPHVLSNIFEQIIRLLLIIFIIPKLNQLSLIYAVTGLILINVISELSSIFILLLFIPKNFKLRKSDIKFSLYNIKEVLNIAIPTTGGRLVGSIIYFLEPILLTLSSSIIGINNMIILKEYGIIEGYVVGLLLLPSFFTNAISAALLPVISKSFSNSKINYAKRKLNQAILFSLIIGIPTTILLIIIPNIFLRLLYNTTVGITYIRILAPFFLLYYIQAPLAVTLQAINRSKCIMIDNLKGGIIKCLLIIVLCTKIGIYGFLIAMISNILIVTVSHYKNVRIFFK